MLKRHANSCNGLELVLFGDGFPEFFAFDCLLIKQPCCLLKQTKKSFNTVSTRKPLIYKHLLAFVSGFLYELSGFQSPFVRIFIRSVSSFIKTNERLNLGQFFDFGNERSPPESGKN